MLLFVCERVPYLVGCGLQEQFFAEFVFLVVVVPCVVRHSGEHDSQRDVLRVCFAAFPQPGDCSFPTVEEVPVCAFGSLPLFRCFAGFGDLLPQFRELFGHERRVFCGVCDRLPQFGVCFVIGAVSAGRVCLLVWFVHVWLLLLPVVVPQPAGETTPACGRGLCCGLVLFQLGLFCCSTALAICAATPIGGPSLAIPQNTVQALASPPSSCCRMYSTT